MTFWKTKQSKTYKVVDVNDINLNSLALPVSWYLAFVQVSPFTDLTD